MTMRGDEVSKAVDRPPLCATGHAVRTKHCMDCHVRHLTICGAFEPDELQHVQKLVAHRRLDAAQSLFGEQEDAEFVYNVMEGTLRLYKLLPDGRRLITGFAVVGDFLGLSRQGRYAYSADAISGVSLCQFRRADLEKLFAQFPALKSRVLSRAHDELSAAQDQMLLLGRKTPMEKVASFLSAAARRMENALGDGSGLALAMSRSDIADYLGLTVETVSRTFSRLRAAHIIALPSAGHVQVVDRQRLEAMASGGNE